MVERLERRTLMVAPLIGLGGTTSVLFAESASSTPVAVLPTIAIVLDPTADPARTVLSATVTYTPGTGVGYPDTGVLAATQGLHGIVVTPYSTASHTLIFTAPVGGSTAADMADALKTVTFADPTNDPDPSPRSVSVSATDSGLETGNSAPVAIAIRTVNNAPIATGTALGPGTIYEGDTTPHSLGLSGVNYEPVERGQALSYRVTTVPPPALGSIFLADGTTVVGVGTYTLDQIRGMQFAAASATSFGAGTFSYDVKDDGGTANGGSDTLVQTINVAVTPVNQAPTLAPIVPPSLVVENSGSQAITLTGIGPGQSNESGQSLTITATSDNPTLVPNPTVGYTPGSSTATLTFAPLADRSGSVTFTVTVTDDGGTANGGHNTTIRTVTFSVVAVNRAPKIDPLVPLFTTTSLSGTQTILLTGIGPGRPSESGQTLTIAATSSDTTIVANPVVTPDPTDATRATLTYTPIPGRSGVVVFTVTVKDNGGTANGGVDATTTTTTVVVNPATDLAVTISPPNPLPSPVYAGQTLTYTARVVNNGPVAANSVVFSQTFALDGSTANLAIVSTAVTGQAAVVTTAAGLVRVALSSPLAAGASFTIQVTVRPTSSGSLTSTATATLAESDPTANVVDAAPVDVTNAGTYSIASAATGSGATPGPVTSVPEGNAGTTTDVTVTVRRTVATSGGFVELLIGGTATLEGSPGVGDYRIIPTPSVANSRFRVSFADDSLVASFTVRILGDNNLEPDEQATFAIAGVPPGAMIDATGSSTAVVIGNDDSLVVTSAAGDGGAGTLRSVLSTASALAGSLGVDAQNHPLPIPISFDASLLGQTIDLGATPLDVFAPISIDASSLRSNSNAPPTLITIAGAGTTGPVFRFYAGAGGSILRALAIATTAAGGAGILVQADRMIIDTAMVTGSPSGAGSIGILAQASGLSLRGSTVVGYSTGLRIDDQGPAATAGGLGSGVGNTVTGNTFRGNGRGVLLAGPGTRGNRIAANRIDGSTGNIPSAGPGSAGDAGLVIDGAGGNTIGGATAASTNLIAGGAGDAIRIVGAAGGTLIQGNQLGVNTGFPPIGSSPALPNSGAGIRVVGGSGTGASPIGLVGNTISGNLGGGVVLTNSAAVQVTGNKIGIDSAGTTPLGNGNAAGVSLDATTNSTVGGNTISGNGAGVTVAGASAGTAIRDNRIGTNVAGTAVMANGGVGVSLVGVTATAAAPVVVELNTISGNLGGVVIGSSSSVRLANNRIGTDAAGTLALGNGAAAGVSLSDVTGSTVDGNTISGNLGGGLAIAGASPGTTILNNRIGTDASGNSAVANGAVGGAAGLAAVGAGSVRISGNQVSGNAADGVRIAGDSAGLVFSENRIGLDAAGTGRLGNGGVGLRLDGPRGQAGATAAIAGNAISGNGGDGVAIASASFVALASNRVGTNAAGTGPIGNGTPNRPANGVTITSGSDLVFDANLVSGNSGGGISLGAGVGAVELRNNRIGTDVNGSSAVPNGGFGVGASGGTAGGLRLLANVISGNLGDGVLLTGVSGTVISGNLVGLNAAGTGPIGNGVGIHLIAASGVSIGGAAGGNVISGNAGDGVVIEGTGAAANAVRGNLIGTGALGVRAVGNGTNPARRGNGIAIRGVGAPAAGGPSVDVSGNLVSGNFGDGICVVDSSGVRVSENKVGLDATASVPIPNGRADAPGAGIRLDGSSGSTVAGNYVAGNLGHGIAVVGAGSIGDAITGNYVGTNPGLAPGLGNSIHGLLFVGAGGMVSANVVAGNLFDGIHAVDAKGLAVDGNGIGAGLDGAAAPGNRGNGIDLGGAIAAAIGLVAGNRVENNGSNGLFAAAPTTTTASAGLSLAIAHNRFDGNAGDGIALTGDFAGNADISGNLIGVADAGGRGNGNDGVGFLGARGVTLFGNSIGRNRGNGVTIDGSSGLEVSSNLIGSDAAPLDTSGNRLAGVLFTNGSSGNTVEFNAIRGNRGQGVTLDDRANANTLSANAVGGNGGNGLLLTGGANGNTISGNAVGTDGDLERPNAGSGVEIVGGTTTGNLLAGNTLASNGSSGAYLHAGAAGNTLRANVIVANLNDGVTVVDAPGNAVRDNTIDRNNSNGVVVARSAGTVVADNRIGTDGANTAGLGNGSAGVSLADVVGAEVSGNVIGSNLSHGILVVNGANNRLLGNKIGLGSDSATPIGNLLNGVNLVQTAGNVLRGNLISSNQSHGVVVFLGGSNTIAGNVIGTDGSLGLARGNKGDGVYLVDTASNTVGGTAPADRNYIGANDLSGVEILGTAGGKADNTPARDNAILGNLLGSSIAPPTPGGSNPLGNKLDGVLITGNDATGTAPSTTGNRVGDPGAGNVILGNFADGVSIAAAGGNAVRGNTIGASQADLGNGVAGVRLAGANGTLVDGGNRIDGNHVDGLVLFGTADAAIQGNLIRSNRSDGIRVQNGSTNNQVGVAGGAANVLLGNGGAGIEIASGAIGNLLRNNLVGVDAGGAVLANGVGVLLSGVAGNVVGGPRRDLGQGNTISGNAVAGVLISGGSANVVQGNLIGTDAAGGNLARVATGTQPIGVLVASSPGNAIVGNVASGNAQSGIELRGSISSGNAVQGNTVGSDPTGTAPILVGPLGGASVYARTAEAPAASQNRQVHGILVNDAPGNAIVGNVVLANQTGIRVDGGNARANAISGNAVGPAVGPVGAGLASPLGNFFGIYFLGAGNNTVEGNAVTGNLSVGISLVTNLAAGNRIRANVVSNNGGYATPGADPNQVVLAPRVNGNLEFGSGIYLESAQSNTIGPDLGAPASAGGGNTVAGNVIAGVYLFNNATNNTIRSNTIVGGTVPSGPYNTQYGVFLFNSVGNIYGVIRSGAYANRISNSAIADFREFTGPVSSGPQVVGSDAKAAASTRSAAKAVPAGPGRVTRR